MYQIDKPDRQGMDKGVSPLRATKRQRFYKIGKIYSISLYW